MTLARVRSAFNAPWIALVFGTIYVLSQSALGFMIAPLGTGAVLRMQCTFFSAADYVAYFGELRQRGLLDVYASHLLLDRLHPIWYVLCAVSWLATLMERRAAPARWNWLLALPWLAGLADVIENELQSVFLLGDSHITTPLAVLSTLSSLLKWSCTAVFMTAIVRLTVQRAPEPRVG